MDLNTTISGPSTARHRTFRWQADGGPTLNAGLVALWFYRGSGPVLLRNPIFLYLFRGGGVRTPCPPLDPHMVWLLFMYSLYNGYPS